MLCIYIQKVVSQKSIDILLSNQLYGCFKNNSILINDTSMIIETILIYESSSAKLQVTDNFQNILPFSLLKPLLNSLNTPLPPPLL